MDKQKKSATIDLDLFRDKFDVSIRFQSIICLVLTLFEPKLTPQKKLYIIFYRKYTGFSFLSDYIVD